MAKKVIIDGLEYALKYGPAGSGVINCGEVVEIIEVRPIYKPNVSLLDLRIKMPETKLRPGMKLRIMPA